MPHTQNIEQITKNLLDFYKQRQDSNYPLALDRARVLGEHIAKLIMQKEYFSNPTVIQTLSIKRGGAFNNVPVTYSNNLEHQFLINSSLNNTLTFSDCNHILKNNHKINNSIFSNLEKLRNNKPNEAHHANFETFNENNWQSCKTAVEVLVNWLFHTYLVSEGITMPPEIHNAINTNLNRKELSTVIPKINLNDIIGREDELHKIEQLLSQNKIVLLHGIGGIGKTKIAQSYFQKHIANFNHIIYVSQSQNKTVKEAFVRDSVLVNNLLLKINTTDTTEIIFNKIIQRIKSSEFKKGLIIIDNYDDNIANELMQLLPNWQILLTSRNKISSYFEPVELKELSDENAKKLFREHYKKETIEDFQLEELLKLVGYHTLTIVLLAKTAQNNRELNVNKLLDVLKAKGLNVANTRISIDHPQEPNKTYQTYMFDCLLTIFDLSGLEKDADWKFIAEWLRYFSVLPSTNIYYEELKNIFMIENKNFDTFSNVLNLLRDNHWLEEINGSFKCHQVIQEVLRHELKPNADNCIILLNYFRFFIENYKLNPIDKQEWLFWIVTVNFHLKKMPLGLLLNMSYVMRKLGIIEESHTLLLQLEQQKDTLSLSEKELIDLYHCLGNSYRDIGELDKSLEYLKVAFRNISLPFEKFLIQTNNNGKNYKHLISLIKIQRNLAITCFENFKRTKDSIFRDKAEQLFHSLEDLQNSFLEKPHIEVFYTYNSLCIIMNDLRNYQRSIEYGEIALEHLVLNDFPQLLKNPNDVLPNTHEQGGLYFNLSRPYYMLKNYDKANEYIEKCIELFKESLPANHPNLEVAYEHYAAIKSLL